jgi:hypothetical protein
MVAKPFLLRAKEGVDVSRIASILSARRKQILLPDDAVGAGELVVEPGVLGLDPALAERAGHLPPGDARLGLLGLVLLPHLRLLLGRRGGDGAELRLVGHVALRHLVEHRRVDAGEQAQLAHLPHRQSEGQGDRVVGPVQGQEPFDRAPLIDGIERGPDDILGQGAHDIGAVAMLGQQDVDLREAGGDGRAYPPVAEDDDETAVLVQPDAGRLNDADGGDGGLQHGVGLGRGGRAPAVVGVLAQAARIDDFKFHGHYSFN